MTKALQSMGVFQFRQKSEAKARLQQLQAQIERLRQFLQSPDSAEIQRAKTGLKIAQKELDDFPAKCDKWKKAVEKACNNYEKRMNIHLDYISGKEL